MQFQGDFQVITESRRGIWDDPQKLDRLLRSVTAHKIKREEGAKNWKANAEIAKYISFYDTERPHQSLGYKTPAEVYCANTVEETKECMLESTPSRAPTSNIERIAVSHLNFKWFLSWQRGPHLMEYTKHLRISTKQDQNYSMKEILRSAIGPS